MSAELRDQLEASIAAPGRRLSVLVDLRAALDGHAGIPHAARVLFRDLCSADELAVEGVIQHGSHFLANGVNPNARASRDMPRVIAREGQVIISIEEQSWFSYGVLACRGLLHLLVQPIGASFQLKSISGERFADFVWRRLFAKSLREADFKLVTQRRFRVLRMPWHVMHIATMVTQKLPPLFTWKVATPNVDVLIAETPFPARVSRSTTLVIRYHDAIPLLMPHTIKRRRYHHGAHFRALSENIRRGAWFVCVSDATRAALLSVFPEAESRSMTIYNTVSERFYDEGEGSGVEVLDILRSNLSAIMPAGVAGRLREVEPVGGQLPFRFLLSVSTIEPRKNHAGLLAAWERIRATVDPNLRLVLVGELGWRHKRILRPFRRWFDEGSILHLEGISADNLRKLYRHADLTVCPSFAEGFGFAGVEAMASGGVVAASDLAVHREVYSDAADYFSPYSAGEISAAIQRRLAITDPAAIEALRARGRQVAQRYEPERISRDWRAALQVIAREQRT